MRVGDGRRSAHRLPDPRAFEPDARGLAQLWRGAVDVARSRPLLPSAAAQPVADRAVQRDLREPEHVATAAGRTPRSRRLRQRDACRRRRCDPRRRAAPHQGAMRPSPRPPISSAASGTSQSANALGPIATTATASAALPTSAHSSAQEGERAKVQGGRHARGSSTAALTAARHQLAPVRPVTAAAGGATRSIDLPELFATRARRARAQTDVPMLLPQHDALGLPPPLPSRAARPPDAWRFDIGAVRELHARRPRASSPSSRPSATASRAGGARSASTAAAPATTGRSPAAPPARRRASSGASATRSTRSRPR